MSGRCYARLGGRGKPVFGAVWLLCGSSVAILCGKSVSLVPMYTTRVALVPMYTTRVALVPMYTSVALANFLSQPRGSNERLPAPGKPPFIIILIFIFDQISDAANLLLIFFFCAFICTVLSACVFVMSFLAANFRRKYISCVLSDMIHMIKTKRDMILSDGAVVVWVQNYPGSVG